MKEELEIDLPNEEDENVGDGAPKIKKEKRKKSKEEKQRERQVVFWTLVIVMVITFLFWLVPVIRNGKASLPTLELNGPEIDLPKPEWKGYVEYKL